MLLPSPPGSPSPRSRWSKTRKMGRTHGVLSSGCPKSSEALHVLDEIARRAGPGLAASRQYEGAAQGAGEQSVLSSPMVDGVDAHPDSPDVVEHPEEADERGRYCRHL